MTYFMCPKCGKAPSRAYQTMPIGRMLTRGFCMDCAKDARTLAKGDFDPEPAGFREFWRAVCEG